MKKILLFTLLVSALFFSVERQSKTQTKPEGTRSAQDKAGPKLNYFIHPRSNVLDSPGIGVEDKRRAHHGEASLYDCWNYLVLG
jgi:hypothetical protein